MSDYLSGIISRALHLEAPVRPVVPSIFETPVSGVLGEMQVETEAYTPAPAARPAKPSAATAGQAEIASEIPAESRGVRPGATPIGPTEPVLFREVRVETTRPEAAVPPVERHVVEHVAYTERVLRERHEVELRELVREAAPPPAAPIAVPVRAPVEAAARHVAAAPAAVVSPVQAVRAAPITPAAEPAPEPEASVRVTIGRVEVRAVFPQSAPVVAEKQRPAPVMPLEEYLKLGNRRAR